MGDSGSIARPEPGFPRTPAKGIVLSALMGLTLAGALPVFSYLSRSLTWFIWLAILFILYRFSKELPLWDLFRPCAPYLAWLGFFLVWGLIVAPNTDLAFALKVGITTIILGLSMAILSSNPRYLRTFSNAAQFAVVGNLLVFVLIVVSGKFAAFIQASLQHAEVYEFGNSRFGGLWGNPNMAGYICVVATILSVLATPWIAWLGRLSCLPLLYLAASRKSLVLYLLILLLYLVLVQGRNLKFWLITVAAAASLALLFVLSERFQAVSQSAREDATISRLLDLKETETTLRGGETRIDLFRHWTKVLAREPWHGYGLKAMFGTVYDENNPQKVVRRGLFQQGTHNTYLGVLIEVGPVGFIAFILVMLHYARSCLLTQGGPLVRWVLASFLLCNLIILFVSHDHLFCFEGKTAFTLFFLLPACAGLREWGWRHALGSP